MSMKSISAAEFARLHAASLHMLDVRTPAEFQSLHVEGAVSCPLSELELQELQQSLRARGFGESDTLYLLCQGGKRAQMAAEKITAGSALRVVVVEGGTEACVRTGVPVKAGSRKTISLERQVRITAGALVFTGVLLGTLVAPGWYALSGFVGLGLMFAGITDTCAMGMLLARMPWNRA